MEKEREDEKHAGKLAQSSKHARKISKFFQNMLPNTGHPKSPKIRKNRNAAEIMREIISVTHN